MTLTCVVSPLHILAVMVADAIQVIHVLLWVCDVSLWSLPGRPHPAEHARVGRPIGVGVVGFGGYVLRDVKASQGELDSGGELG